MRVGIVALYCVVLITPTNSLLTNIAHAITRAQTLTVPDL